MGGYTHGKKSVLPDMLQRIGRLETFCADLIAVMQSHQMKKVERSSAKIEKMKLDLKDSKRKRSLQKRKPIRRTGKRK